MTLTILACVDHNNVIAVHGKQAYVLKNDREFYNNYVRGKLQLCTHKTYTELQNYYPEGDVALLTRQTATEVIKYAAAHPEETIVSGGSVAYGLAFGLAQKILISRVHVTRPDYARHATAVFFPRSLPMLYKRIHTEVLNGFDLETWVLWGKDANNR